ncbi:hypothetical protein BDY24DRAFT_418977 [Mrakia frigida]|uniref:uncharacterized protein n=1 Tax=Mrakia frigida TaxID=29902 RepID=UPI003FCC17CC
MFSTLKNTLKSTAYYSVGTSLFIAISLASLALNKASPFESSPAPAPASALPKEVGRARASSVSSDASSSSSVPSSSSSSSSSQSDDTSSPSSSRSTTSTLKPSPAEIFAAFHKDSHTRPYKTSTSTSVKKITSVVRVQHAGGQRSTLISRRTISSVTRYSSFSDLYLISQ